jgi:hypothetical protein
MLERVAEIICDGKPVMVPISHNHTAVTVEDVLRQTVQKLGPGVLY